ncbi:MAG TPA: T9SS type A sorting domain-containing protein [Chitinophagaceae bacterium]|nr:T9SS type A sorting domain-containing protein [Chitinophagaceae bacterium]
MKKIVLIFVLMASAAAVQQSYGQACQPGNIRHWTGNGDPGDMGVGPAPITINGLSADWEAVITGPFAYTGVAKGGYESDPYTSPIAGGNVQVDGLKAAGGSNFDRDCPGQNHRDLRYFAFTYDQKNVYFIFRRPSNNTAQVSLYYFIDINVDGFMKQGEPVIHVTFNNSGSSIEMGYYHPVDFNGTAAGSYDPVKGNIMVASVSRIQNCPGTTQWTVGAADGWSMPGDFVKLGNGVSLPPTVAGEVFLANTLTDTHIDGTEPGYGVEFAVPWKYLGMYTASGLTGGTALNYNNVFTWHVSLVGGNSGVSGAEDNAGGCCSGLAFSGNANTDLTSSSTIALADPKRQYRVRLTYTNQVNLPTNVTMAQVSFSNVVQYGITPPDPTTQYTVTVYPGDGSGNPVGGGQSYVYSSGTNPPYNFISSGADVVILCAAAPATVEFIVDIDFGIPYHTKSATASFLTGNQFNVNTITCGQLGESGDEVPVGVQTTLPVIFQSFTATRNHSSVLLKWETSLEQNSSGFAVERNINGTWQQIAFVPSQAVGGNSIDVLSYQYIDLNNTKGITQYRIRQVDFDNKSKYTEVRTVRGDGQLGKVIVYPNPSMDGKVNVSFEDATTSREVSLFDMSGRMIRQVKAVTSNNITIENLTPGMYTLRVVMPETGEQVVNKIVVNKR